MIGAYIVATVLGVCLIAVIIYVCVLLERITKLNEYIKELDARTKPNTEMIAIRHRIDTYAMASNQRFTYLDQTVEAMVRKLGYEIAQRLHDRLHTELLKRLHARKEICYYSPLNLECTMDIRIPVYRVDWETIYLNGERVNELDDDRRAR